MFRIVIQCLPESRFISVLASTPMVEIQLLLLIQMQKETQIKSNLSELTQPGHDGIKCGIFTSFTLQSISLTTLHWFAVRPNEIVITIQPLIHVNGIPRLFRLHTPLVSPREPGFFTLVLEDTENSQKP